MISGFFGLPGSGKTTFLTKIAQRELRRIRCGHSKYKYVFTNFYCDGTLKINFSDLGKFYIHDSLILIDEITLFADNRDWKRFGQDVTEFFVMHRHDRNDVIYFTQFYNNVDKKIRDLTFDLFFVRPTIFNFTIATRIFRILDINDQTHDIEYGYRFWRLFDLFSGGIFKLCFRPRWYKYFDSYESTSFLKPDLKLINWSDYSDPLVLDYVNFQRSKLLAILRSHLNYLNSNI